MLTNAKEMRKNYLDRVEEAAMDIITTISCIEGTDAWEEVMDDDYCVDVLYYIEGENDYAEKRRVDITEVYDFLTTVIDPEISPTKSVIEALEEIFEIDCDPWSFELKLKGYSSDSDE